jgi:hypothetical protein
LKSGCADDERPDSSAIGYAMKGTFEIAGGADAGCEIPGTPVCEGGDAGREETSHQQLCLSSFVFPYPIRSL